MKIEEFFDIHGETNLENYDKKEVFRGQRLIFN